MVRHGILIAEKYKVVRCVAVLELSYGRLRCVAAGSDPVGASFPKSDPHFNLQIRSLYPATYVIDLLQLLSSDLPSSRSRVVCGSLHLLMHDMALTSFASPSAPTGKMFGLACLRHPQGRWSSWETYISPCHLCSNLVSLRPHQCVSFSLATLRPRLQACAKLIL